MRRNLAALAYVLSPQRWGTLRWLYSFRGFDLVWWYTWFTILRDRLAESKLQA